MNMPWSAEDARGRTSAFEKTLIEPRGPGCTQRSERRSARTRLRLGADWVLESPVIELQQGDDELREYWPINTEVVPL